MDVSQLVQHLVHCYLLHVLFHLTISHGEDVAPEAPLDKTDLVGAMDTSTGGKSVGAGRPASPSPAEKDILVCMHMLQ